MELEGSAQADILTNWRARVEDILLNQNTEHDTAWSEECLNFFVDRELSSSSSSCLMRQSYRLIG